MGLRVSNLLWGWKWTEVIVTGDKSDIWLGWAAISVGGNSVINANCPPCSPVNDFLWAHNSQNASPLFSLSTTLPSVVWRKWFDAIWIIKYSIYCSLLKARIPFEMHSWIGFSLNPNYMLTIIQYHTF